MIPREAFWNPANLERLMGKPGPAITAPSADR